MRTGATYPFRTTDQAVLSRPRAYALYDTHPASPGHLLILPRRHVADWFATTQQERQAILGLADAGRDFLIQSHAPDGFNLGTKVGEAAGQTLFHVHLHLIPRYRGDVANPRAARQPSFPISNSTND
jgi:diadenosine tetraphosphate (Ap4A) HIT family hydrolase